MPDGAGTHEATGEMVNELVLALPHGSLVTVQINPSLVIEHPITRCVLSVNTLQVSLWKCFPPNPNPNLITLTLTGTL